jgi:uncharacterized protein (TIGR02996 family)
MKHPDWPAFVTAIIAEPDDDTRRLVAADFLEEHGEADRAAFVRVQIELARLNASELSHSPEADELRKKERAFLGPKSDYAPLWAAEECPELVRVVPHGRASSPLARLQVEGTERLTWRRGFVEEIRCPAAEWLRHGVAVRGRNPVRDVFLTGGESVNRDAWYTGLDALRGLRRLHLGPIGHFPVLNELGEWLQGWLPGTEVEWVPF